MTKDIVCDLLAQADIKANGERPWDIQIHDERFYNRVLRDHSLGLGEAYMDGWWDCHQIDDFIFRIRESIENKLTIPTKAILRSLIFSLMNFQTRLLSKKVAREHYDIGNNLYEVMLDKSMNYSCAYWKGAKTLDEAQQNKMELICRKLMLKPGLRLLDVGCGWGGMAKYAAEHYGVEVVGVTISKEQKKLADERCKGLPIDIRLQDYRDIPLHEKFDRVVSVGMFEHVGFKNYRQYMKVIHRHLTDDGLFLLHTIGSNTPWAGSDPWISKYIFPHSELPTVPLISKSVEGLFIMEDWHNFGQDYDKTLLAWHENFNKHWPELESAYGNRFKRMWNFYLLICAGGFRARKLQLWQVLLTKHGLRHTYPVRELI